MAGFSRRSTDPDPIGRFRRWFARAKRTEVELPEAFSLATSDRRGRASVRIVLLKSVDDDGFVFYTNRLSRKGRELSRNPRASAVFHWKTRRRQVRIEGAVEEVSPDEADAYWRTRPRTSQIAAVASTQSRRLGSRRQLIDRFRSVRRKFAGREIPRPRGWTGYRIRPESIEFWTHREHRLHDRELFEKTRKGWRCRLLQP